MNGSWPQIFIIDDDISFGKSLVRLLKSKGYEARYFSSADSFLRSSALGETGAVAIIDIQMPYCDGFALMDKMHACGCAMPIIVITGVPLRGSRTTALQKGAVGYLEKPFSDLSLLQLIRSR